METKAKSGAGAPKASPTPKAEKPTEKVEKKEATTPRKVTPAAADPTPAAPVPEKPAAEDTEDDQQVAPEGTEAGEASTDSLENLKPFLIGGAVIAAAAILVGALLLARRN